MYFFFFLKCFKIDVLTKHFGTLSRFCHPTSKNRSFAPPRSRHFEVECGIITKREVSIGLRQFISKHRPTRITIERTTEYYIPPLYIVFLYKVVIVHGTWSLYGIQ